ncbi:Putative pentatricopeptide repeat-containing protein At5g13230, mitochondrial [Linum grandiflorum]
MIRSLLLPLSPVSKFLNHPNRILRCSSPFRELSGFTRQPQTFAAMLQQCIKNGDHTAGKAIHCEILKMGNCLDLFARNILLNLYVNEGSVTDARKVFDAMPERNTISFVTLIQGFTQSGEFIEGFQLFSRLHREGHELNPFVFTTVLKLLVGMELAQELTPSIHSCVCKLGHESNAFIGTALVDAYSVSGLVECARRAFDEILCKDMVAWTGMVACYAENDRFQDSLQVFSDMRKFSMFKPNHFTLAAALKACVGLEAFHLGKALHGCTLKTRYEPNLFVAIGLLELYLKFGDPDDALRVFEEMPRDNVVPWSFMIARHAQSSMGKEALELFRQMRREMVAPNQYTFASVLQACATTEALDFGKQLHCHVLRLGFLQDVFITNALMDVYAKCSQIENSLTLFLDSSNVNDVSWNTMIVGFVHAGDLEKALSFFKDMLECHDVQATEVTYSSALRACASLAALEPGTQIHCLGVKTLYDENTVVGNALIDMYAKCGSIKDARRVFDRLSKNDEVSWNAMISGYSMHGLAEEALRVFDSMQENGITPNQTTFVGVLSACSNNGLLDRGESYVKSMTEDYGIEPCSEHYSCMVWLLGRSGDLNRAYKLIQEMPFEPTLMVWRALLGSCVIHNDTELGKLCAEQILKIEPEDESTHVLLSNMYARAKSWGDVASVRRSMKRKGVVKEPGLSWIENQGDVHYFTVDDVSHPDLKMMYGMLEWLNMKVRRKGYSPDCNVVLRDIEDGRKARHLWVHSERLALAFGLIRTPGTSPIRIMKNLRICADCHAVMKLVSKIVKRDVIVRDMNRFHRFENGKCSCGDYW